MKYLTEEEVDYISALGMIRTSKEAAYESLERLAKLYRENITKQYKLIRDNKNSPDKALFNKILQTYDNALYK